MRERREKLILQTVCFFRFSARGLLAKQEMLAFFFAALAFKKLSNLTADAPKGREQSAIRFANLMAEKFHHAQEVFAGHDRKCERRVQVFRCRHSRARKVGISRHIRNPGRTQVGPYAAGQTNAGPKRGLLSHSLKISRPSAVRWPDFETSQNIRLIIEFPHRAHFPLKRVADSLNDARHRIVERRRFRQDARD